MEKVENSLENLIQVCENDNAFRERIQLQNIVVYELKKRFADGYAFSLNDFVPTLYPAIKLLAKRNKQTISEWLLWTADMVYESPINYDRVKVNKKTGYKQKLFDRQDIISDIKMSMKNNVIVDFLYNNTETAIYFSNKYIGDCSSLEQFESDLKKVLQSFCPSIDVVNNKEVFDPRPLGVLHYCINRYEKNETITKANTHKVLYREIARLAVFSNLSVNEWLKKYPQKLVIDKKAIDFALFLTKNPSKLSFVNEARFTIANSSAKTNNNEDFEPSFNHRMNTLSNSIGLAPKYLWNCFGKTINYLPSKKEVKQAYVSAVHTEKYAAHEIERLIYVNTNTNIGISDKDIDNSLSLIAKNSKTGLDKTETNLYKNMLMIIQQFPNIYMDLPSFAKMGIVLERRPYKKHNPKVVKQYYDALIEKYPLKLIAHDDITNTTGVLSELKKWADEDDVSLHVWLKANFGMKAFSNELFQVTCDLAFVKSLSSSNNGKIPQIWKTHPNLFARLKTIFETRNNNKYIDVFQWISDKVGADFETDYCDEQEIKLPRANRNSQKYDQYIKLVLDYLEDSFRDRRIKIMIYEMPIVNELTYLADANNISLDKMIEKLGYVYDPSVIEPRNVEKLPQNETDALEEFLLSQFDELK